MWSFILFLALRYGNPWTQNSYYKLAKIQNLQVKIRKHFANKKFAQVFLVNCRRLDTNLQAVRQSFNAPQKLKMESCWVSNLLYQRHLGKFMAIQLKHLFTMSIWCGCLFKSCITVYIHTCCQCCGPDLFFSDMLNICQS